MLKQLNLTRKEKNHDHQQPSGRARRFDMLTGTWTWPNLTDKEREIVNLAMDVARREIAPRAEAHDLEGTFVRDSIDALFESGLMGANIPEKYGGMGGSDLSAVIAQEAIAAACGSTGASICFHYLTNHLIHSAGPERLREKYLPALATNKLGAFCLNEGGGIQFTFVDTSLEDKGDHWLLDGGKPFVTSAGQADLYVVYCQRTKEALLPQFSQEWVLVEGQWDGVSSPVTYDPLGLRGASNGRMVFDQVKVPRENLIGEQPWSGIRASVAKEESAVGPQVIGMGCAGAALDAAVHHARVRGMQPWMIQKLGPAIARLNALRCYHWIAARNMAGDFEPTVRMQVEMKTMGGSDPYWICDEVIEIMGGNSLMRDSPIQRYYRDARTAAYLMLPMESRRERVGVHNCERDAALEYQDQPSMVWEPVADHAFRLSRGRIDTDPNIPPQARDALSRATIEGIARSQGHDEVLLDDYIQQLTRVLSRQREAQMAVAQGPPAMGAEPPPGSPLGRRRG
jgi:alkylation response protein AidB-like acyl-CoA dehydrogenase